MTSFPTALISLSFAVALGGAANARSAIDTEGPIVTGPEAAPADTPLADPLVTAPASNGPIAFVSSPMAGPPAPDIGKQGVETVTSDQLTEAELADQPDKTFEISPGLTVGSRPVNEEQAAGGLLRSNQGLQRPWRKAFGLGFKF